MRSGKNSKAASKIHISFDGRVGSMPNCCGVGMITNHGWRVWEWKKQKSYYTNRLVNVRVPNYAPFKVPTRRVSFDLFKIVRAAFKNYSLLYIALPQNVDEYKKATKWYLAHGFKVENKTKSKHGNYTICVLSNTRTNWEKSYAL
jgi:hypothetical protein